MSLLDRVRWYWNTRNCPHPATRGTSGEERMHYGYRSRCMACGKVLKAEPTR